MLHKVSSYRLGDAFYSKLYDEDIQDLESSACGYFCIAFIKFLHNKQDKQEAYKGFLKLFKLDTLQNDKILQELIYN